MKVLKIVLILLVPALAIIGCRKSKCEPRKQVESTVSTPSNTVVEQPANNQQNMRLAAPAVSESTFAPIVGSGDDDRDGGDKRKKAAK